MINSLKRFRRCFAKIAFFGVLSSLIPVIPVYASVVVTPATGGSTISADTNGATGTGVYTLLTGPTITEGAVGDVHAGTIILNAPTGFAFDTGGVAPTVLIGCVTGKCTKSNRNVNGVVMTNGITADSPSAITSRTASTITFTVTSAGSNGVKNYLTWQNVRVRPTAGSPLAPSGNITKGGTAIVTGATALTNFGTLGEGPGSTNLKLAITIQPSLIALNGIDFAVKPVVALQDQFGNTLTSNSSATITRTAVLSTQVCGGTAGSGTLSSTPASGATITNGVLTYTALQYSAAESIKICFSSSGATSVLSNQITVGSGDVVAPTLTSVSISSNNASTTRAKVGDTVTLSFTASEQISAPTVVSRTGGVIVTNSVTVTNTSGNDWTATYLANSADTSGAVTFNIGSYHDNANNNGSTVTSVTDSSSVTFDKTAPTAPSIPDLAAADDTGISSTDNITTQTTDLTFTGTAEANSLVQLYDAGVAVGSPVSAIAGSWSIDLALAVGSHTISAKATDGTGNISATSSVLTVTVDTTTPVLAVVTPVPTPDNDTTPNFTFSTTEAGTITYGGSCSSASTSTTSGNKTITLSTLTAGIYSDCTITVTDAAGNPSSALSIPPFTIDTTAPVLAVVTPVPTPDNDTTPSFTFSTTEAGTITYGGSCSSVTTSTTVGNETITFNTLSAGTYSNCTIAVTDVAGNTSTVLAVPTFVIDTTAPVLTVVTPVPTPDNDTTPNFVFSSTEAGTITYGGSCSAIATSTLSGSKTITFDELSEGVYSDCTITVTDSAGNVSSVLSVASFTIDITSPILAVVTPVPTPDNDTTPNFTFSTTEAGTITYGGSCSSASTSTTSGNKTITFSTLPAGTYADCTVRVTDAAGNASSLLGVPSFTIDTTAPVLTVVTAVPTPSNNTTPSFTFNTTEAGTITYGGSCSSITASATVGSNLITFNALASGTYSTCTVSVTDSSGNISSVLTIPAFTIDTTAPVLAVVTPVPTPDNDTTPNFIFSSTEAGTITYGGSCSSVSTSTTSGNKTITFNALTPGTYSDCTVTMTDAAGNISSVLSVPSFTIDTTAPVLAVVTPVPTPDNDTTPNFTFSTTEAGTITYGGSCSSASTSTISGDKTITLNSLVAGTYTNCTVTVTDSAGNVSSVLAIPSFTIDTVSPVLAVITPVPTSTNNTTPSFVFSSTEAGTITYGGSCFSVTGSAMAGHTTTTFDTLPPGTYTNCTITVTDAAGNISSVLAVPSFTIDTTAPVLTVITPVPTPDNDTTPSFVFSSNEGGTITYGGSCSSITASATIGNTTTTFSTLAPGTYSDCTITVTDSAGNISATLSVPSFTIDTTAPVLAVVTPVPTPGNDTTPDFAFSSTEAGTITYGGSCSSVTASAASGDNTVTFNALSSGTYINCTVRVTDAAGNLSSILSVPSFTIDATAPVLAIVTPVPTPDNDTTPNFVFSSTEAGTITYGGSCSAASTSTTSGNKTVTFNALTPGTYTDCTIIVTDTAGNVSAVLLIPSFTIDTDAPILAVITPVPTPDNDTTPSFTFSTTEAGTITYGGSCSATSTSAIVGDKTVTFSTLTPGVYTNCTITVTDAAGNASAVLSVPSFTIDTVSPVLAVITPVPTPGTDTTPNFTFSSTEAGAITYGGSCSSVTLNATSGNNTITLNSLASGTYTNCTVSVTDASGNVSLVLSIPSFAIDISAPVLAIVTPVPTPDNDTTPSFIFSTTEAGAITYGGSCSSLSTSTVAGNKTIALSTLPDGTYADCTITVTDASGNDSNVLAVPSFTIDTVLPILAVVIAVPTPGNDTTPDFTFSSTEEGTITYGGSCSSASENAIAGNATVTFNALSAGTYINCTITVTDEAGNVSVALSVPSFTIDTSAPTLAVITPVSTPTSDTTPSFVFSTTEAGAITYGGSCSSASTSTASGNKTLSFNVLAPGTYSDCTITITDSAGNISAILSVPSFTIDTLAPILAVVIPVPTPTNDTTPDFIFSSTEAGTITYGGSCSSASTAAISGNKTVTFDALIPGTYTNCTITVTDEAGNASLTLSVPAFTIDTTDPVLAIVTPVLTPSNNTTPTFVFSSTEAGTITYGGSCSSFAGSALSGNNSIVFNILSSGIYTNCTITVTDLAGNISSVLSVPDFTIDTTPPILAVVTVVLTPSNDTTPTFVFSTSKAGTITYGGSCSSAATSTASGDTTLNFDALGSGVYSNCTVTVTDTLGNISSALSVPSFTIDATAPILTLVTPVPTSTQSLTPSFTFSTTEAGTITYGGSCSSMISIASLGDNIVSFSPLTPGLYSDCTIIVTDAAGNPSVVFPIPSFTIEDPLPPAVSLVILNPADSVVGSSTRVTVEAHTELGEIATTFNGGVTIIVDGSATIVGGDALITMANGVGTMNITDTVAETVTLSLSDTQSTGLDVFSTQDVAFAPAAFHHFVFANIGNQIAGVPFILTITAKDQYGNSVPSFVGTANLTASAGSVSSTQTTNFVAGSVTQSVTMTQAGTGITLTATNALGAETGLSNAFNITAGATTAYFLNDPGDMAAGTRLGYTVTRKDSFGNLVESGIETVSLFNSSAGNAAFYDAASNGNVITSVVIASGQSAANFWYYDDADGSWNITATDNTGAPDGLNGITDAVDVVTISAAPVIATMLTIVVQPTAEVGDTVPVTIRAENASGQLDTTYTRSDNTIILGSTGDSTANGGIIIQIVNGIGTTNISDTVAESITLSVNDVINALNDSATAPVTFTAGPFHHFTFDTIGTQIAGIPFGIILTAKDQYENIATTFTGTADLATTAGSITPAITGSFVAGLSSESVTVTLSGTGRSIGVTRTGGSETGMSNLFDVNAGLTSKYLLSDPGDMTVGTRLGYVVTRKDADGNLVTAGTETANLYSNSTGASFYGVATSGTAITTIAFASGSSSANFWYGDTQTGSWIVTASDNSLAPDGLVGIDDATDGVTVGAATIFANKFIITGVDSADLGSTIHLTVKAIDANLDTQSNFQQDVTVQLSGGGRITPGDAQQMLIDIVNGVGSLDITSTSTGLVMVSLSDTEGTGLDISDTKEILFNAIVPIIINTGGGGGGGFFVVPGQPTSATSTAMVDAPAKISFSGQAFPAGVTSLFAIVDGKIPLKQDQIRQTNGKFSVNVESDLEAADHYGIIVYDKNGRPSQAKVFKLDRLTELLKVQDLLISPTIDLTRDILAHGDFLSVIGYAAPGNVLEFEIDGKVLTRKVTIPAGGLYKLLYNTDEMGFGSHNVRVRQVTGKNQRSDYSIQKSFELTDYIITAADLNKDGKIDVRDLSIFNALWYNPKSPTRNKIDLNNDGKVDIQDFSIFSRTLQKIQP